MAILVTLTPPPSVNRLYGYRAGGRYMTKEGTHWKESAGWEAVAQVGRPLLQGDIEVTVYLYGIKLDIDNGLKATLDAMQGVLYENDRQIKRLYVEKHECLFEPYIRVAVEELQTENNPALYDATLFEDDGK